MNHIYRLCWNRTLCAWVPASELAKSKGVGTTRGRPAARLPLRLSLLSVLLGTCGLAWAGSTPTGGQIVGGSGSIVQSGNLTTIKQNSQTLSLNWQSFDIGANQTVDFMQPGRDAIAVNCILGNTASDIEGHLNANGQVWLINPNGVLFGKNAQVNVGGIVASALDLDQGTPGSGTVRFAGNGKGSVVNLGTITVSPGGYAALLGNTVSNQGAIRAQLGTVALAGGSAMTLTFADNHLMHLVVDTNAVKSLVENRQLIVADGGQVLMTAGARNSLIDSAVNNTGTVQAQTVQNHDGTITLLGGMEAGTVNVAGTLDASAPQGGKAGFIETSGAHAHIADGSVITTKAAGAGQNGTWLVDPADFTIAASGGDITASQLATSLANGNVTLASAQGTVNTNGSGNVNVNQAVTWGGNTTLTLTASNNINLNAAITNTGASGKTVLNAGNAFVNNVGAAGLSGNWAIYSASPTATGEKLNGLTEGFIQYNAPIGTAAASGATGNGLFYASAASINITGLASASKSYDGTSNLLASQLTDTLSGGGSGDTLKAITGGYSQSDVGTGLTITAPTSSSAYTIANGSVPVYGYAVSGASSANSSAGVINAAQLYATVVGDPTKVYDGTETAALTSSNYYISGLVAGQTVTVNQPSSVNYASADVNTNNGTIPAGAGGQVAITATFASTNFSAGSGTKLSNYVLPTSTSATAAALASDATAGYGTIKQAPVYLSGVVTTSKTYDASTSDTLNTSNASIYGVVNGDAVTLNTANGAGNFASLNAGNNLAVAITGFTLSGNATKVADYNLIAPTSLTANIYQKALTVTGVTTANKVYDGTTSAFLNTSSAMLSGFVNSADQNSTTLSTGSAQANFNQSDVGSNLPVTASGLAVNNSNYSVTQPLGLTASITPAPLTIAFNASVSPNKVYDGTDYATLSGGNFTVNGMVGTQNVSVSQAPATYAGNGAPNVGSYNVTSTLQSSDLSFTNGAKSGNYTFNTSVTGSGSIVRAPLQLVVNGNPSKVYDGNSSAALNAGNFTLSGVIPGETINMVGSFTGNYYNGAPSTPESNVGTWGVTSSLTSGNYQFAASSGNPSGSLGNYVLPTTALGFGTITPKSVGSQITAGVNGASKVYDGNTSITLGQNNIAFYGFVNSDSATVTSAITGTFGTKNVGTQPLSATLNSSHVSFTCGGGGSACLSNYTYDGIAGDTLANANWSITAYGSGAIQQKNLYVTLTGATKQYDGNATVLPLGNGNFTVYGYVGNNTGSAKDSGWVSGEGATITPTATFTYGSPNVARDANGNVLGNIDVKGSLTYQNYASNASTQLSNYKLVYSIDQDVGTITPAPLYVSGVTAQNKIYDGGNGALIDISNGQLAGLANVDKNASAITLNIGNTTASSADGIASSTGGTLVANSNGTFTASNSPVGGTFASANAGNNQAVATTISLGGNSAGNYTLEMPNLTANVTPRPLAVAGISANNKPYDGTTAATFSFSTPTFSQASGTGTAASGLLTQDANNVSLNQGSGTGAFATVNANTDLSGAFLSPNGQAIAVTASGFTLSGNAAGNYLLSQPAGLTADVAQRQITATLTGPITKAYDGTSSITIPAAKYSTSGWVSGQNATIFQTQSAYYGDPANKQSNAGTYDVTANLVSSDWSPGAGTSLSNYALPAQVVGNQVGIITPLMLNLSAQRVYDTTTDVYSSISGNVTNANNANAFGTLNGINGDQFTVSGTGATSAKDVGNYSGTGASGQPTSGQGFNLGTLALVAVGGANIGNYTLVGGTDSYTITQAPLNISGATVTAKVYNASTAATVTGATLTHGNAAGDVLGNDNTAISSSVAGTFASANANAGLSGTASTPTAVTINGAAITGSDAQNYAIVQPAGLAGTINQAPVTISGVRQYTGNTAAAVASGTTWTIAGTVGSQTLTVSSGSGTVSSANVGTYTDTANTFSLNNLALGNGSNGGLASNYAITAGGNQFQITPMLLTLAGTRVYDGSSNADANLVTSVNGVATAGCGADCVTLTGANGESLNLAGTGTGALASANVAGSGGSPAQVAFVTSGGGITGLTLTGDGSAAASNYTLAGGITITPYVLSFSGSRDYDGTTGIYGSVGTTVNGTTNNTGLGTLGGLQGDQFTVSGKGALISANKGSYASTNAPGNPAGAQQIGVNGLSLVAAGSTGSGTDIVSNYTLAGGSDTYVINSKQVTLTGTRAYDGLTDANGGKAGTSWVVNGVVSGDASTVVVSGNGSVSSANVGSYSDSASNGNVLTSNIGNGGLSLGGGAAGNYTLATTGNTFIINSAALRVTANNAGKTYDGQAYSGGNGVSYSGFVNGETSSVLGGNVAYGGASQGAVNAGTYGITASGLTSGNYAISYVGGALTVGKAALTVTANNASKTYNGVAYSGGNGVSYSGFVNGETSSVLGGSVAYGGSSQNAVNAGSYGITASGLSSSNYALSYAPGSLVINPATITLTGIRQYDGMLDANGSSTILLNTSSTCAAGATCWVVNGMVASDKSKLSVGGTGSVSSANVGSYANSGTGNVFTSNVGNGGVSLGGSAGGNYTLSTTGNTFIINKAALTVTASNASKTYDGQAYAGGNGVSYSGFVNGETSSVLGGSVAYGGSSQGAVNAGTYDITASGLTSGNYALGYVGGTLNVGKAALTVTANNAGKTYDGLAYAGGNGVSYSGFVNGETSSVLGGSVAYGGSSQGAVNAGAYAITASGLTSANYTLGYVGGTLSVGKAALTVTANNANKTYDGQAYAGGNGVSYSGFVNGETSSVLGGSVAYGGLSQGAVNAGTYAITASGLTSANYTLGYVGGTLNVGKAALTVTANNAGKTYDGLAYAGGNGVSYSGFVNGETSSVLGGSVAYGGSSQGAVNAGTYAITASGLTSANYTLGYVGGTLNVGQAALTVTANNANKTYDGLAYAGGNGVSYSGFVNGETSSVLGGSVAYGGLSQGAVNAGTYAITASGLTSANYALSYVGGTLNVGKAALTVTANNANKTYDGQAYAGGNGVSYSGFVNGETSSVLGGSVAYGGSSQGAVNAGAYAITASGLTSANYTLGYVSSTLNVGKAALTVTANNAGKTYDGLAYAGGNGVSYSGFVNGETSSVLGGSVAYGGSSQGAVNAGTYAITASGLTSGNYALGYVDGTLGVGKAILNLSGRRVYDAGTNADGSVFGNNGVIDTGIHGEQVVATGAGTASSKNIGLYSTVNTGTNALNPTGLGLSNGSHGGLASNYTLVGGTDTLTITPAMLNVAGTVVGTKTYDGNTTASLSGSTLAGVLGSDVVTLGNDTTGTFATPNAGTGIGVTAATMTIGGGDAGNYLLTQPSGLTGTVTPVVLDLTATRVYDGTTNAIASLFGNGGVLTGVNGQTLTLGGTGMLSSKNVGTQQPFASSGLSGFTLSGNGTALAGNYTLAGGVDWVSITPLAITVDAAGKSKTYDGTTAAGVMLGSSGVLGGDTVAFTGSSADFTSPNAGTAVSITVTGITAAGADAGNYTFNTTASTRAGINPYALNLSGTRVYDATTGAYASDFGTVMGLGGDAFTLSGAGVLTSKNVGSYSGTGGSSFGLGGLALVSSGTGLSGNYTLAGGTDKYTITPAALAVAGTTVGTKTYDATNTAGLSGATLIGVLGGDAVTLGNDATGTFTSPNAGKQAVITGMTIGGGDAGNYVLVQPTGLSGSINPYVLNLTGTRVYDGTTSAVASLFGNAGVLAGIGGQTVALSGTGQVGDKNVASDKPFASLGSLTLSNGGNGGFGGNYTLLGGNDTLSITPKTIAVDATGTNKTYDGNVLDTVTLGSGGVVAADSVQFGYGAANFANPNVGIGIGVTVTGVQLSGADAGNYLLASPTVYTHADIVGAQASAFGISSGTLASVGSVLGPTELATPYGIPPQDTVGNFTGNKKRQHHPVENNLSRDDFTSGLALKVIDGGLRVPAQAMP